MVTLFFWLLFRACCLLFSLSSYLLLRHRPRVLLADRTSSLLHWLSSAYLSCCESRAILFRDSPCTPLQGGRIRAVCALLRCGCFPTACDGTTAQRLSWLLFILHAYDNMLPWLTFEWYHTFDVVFFMTSMWCLPIIYAISCIVASLRCCFYHFIYALFPSSCRHSFDHLP